MLIKNIVTVFLLENISRKWLVDVTPVWTYKYKNVSNMKQILGGKTSSIIWLQILGLIFFSVLYFYHNDILRMTWVSKNGQIHLEARYNCLDRLFLEVPCFKFNAYGQKIHSQATTSVKPLTIKRFVLNLYVCACSCHETHFRDWSPLSQNTQCVFQLLHQSSPSYFPRLGPLKLLLMFICAFCMYVLFVCAFPHTCVLLSLFFCSSQPVIAILWGPRAKPVTKPQANAPVKTVWRVSHATVVLKATSRADLPLPPA